MHIVIGAREDPPLPLPRLRARNQALESRTEGWITGLQLAALALQEIPDAARAEAFVAAFTGDDRYITDYLVVEVLQRQPQAIRDFLRQVAILDQLTALARHCPVDDGRIARANGSHSPSH